MWFVFYKKRERFVFLPHIVQAECAVGEKTSKAAHRSWYTALLMLVSLKIRPCLRWSSSRGYVLSYR